jgi:hypothetical protein
MGSFFNIFYVLGGQRIRSWGMGGCSYVSLFLGLEDKGYASGE